MKKRFFTLTEMVVIMVCITILAAALSACRKNKASSRQSPGGASSAISSLAGAEERAKQVDCVAKLKQIGQAEFMYSSCNKDYLAVPDSFDANAVVPQVRSTLAANGASSRYQWVNAGDKLLMGGFLGQNLSRETYEAKEKAFHCPADEKNWQKSGTVSSYNNALLGSEAGTVSATNPRKRLIVGRDNPGAAIWYDHHQTLVAVCGSRSANNHSNTVNVCYFGSHVGSQSVKNGSEGTWALIDQITY